MKDATYYTVGQLNIEVCFPENKVCCKNCDLSYADSLGRMKCRVTHELVFYPNEILDDCPIEFTGEIRGTKHE